jgi:predicted nucleic acid-binding protein
MACHIGQPMRCEASMKTLFDTNIVIDALNGYGPARGEMRAHSNAAISVISYLEVMAGTDARTLEPTQKLLNGLKIIDVDVDIADYAKALIQERALSLTDALIVATAQATGRTLLTRDAKLLEGGHEDPVVIVPYVV